MSLDGYKIRDQQAVHFITFATVQWIDVFTRSDYVNIVVDSIAYCQKEKGFIGTRILHHAKPFTFNYFSSK